MSLKSLAKKLKWKIKIEKTFINGIL